MVQQVVVVIVVVVVVVEVVVVVVVVVANSSGSSSSNIFAISFLWHSCGSVVADSKMELAWFLPSPALGRATSCSSSPLPAKLGKPHLDSVEDTFVACLLYTSDAADE